MSCIRGRGKLELAVLRINPKKHINFPRSVDDLLLHFLAEHKNTLFAIYGKTRYRCNQVLPLNAWRVRDKRHDIGKCAVGILRFKLFRRLY
jgi:hypothetical protein